MRQRARGLWLGLLAAAGAACAAAANGPSPPVRLGILSTIGEISSTQVFAPTLEALKHAWGQDIEVSYWNLDTLPQAVFDKKLDFFIANAGSFTHLQTKGLARHLATRKIDKALDPNFSMGGIFFVKSDNTAIQTFEDMRGKSAVAVAPNAFGGLSVHLGEIHARGFNPDAFFSSLSFTGYPMQRVLGAMRSDQAQIGVMRACLLEDLMAKGQVRAHEFRVIGAKDEPMLKCQTSTALYPDWVFAATSQAQPELSRKACAALFSMPEDAPMHWSVASDFTRIDALFKTLRIGHYAYLREWTLQRIWQEYRGWVLVLCAALGLVVWHAVVVTFEVRRKTRRLRLAMQQRSQAQNEVLVMQTRLQALERASLVGMLSNMVAHELKQPLGAISNYADGICTVTRCASDAPAQLEMIGIAARQIIEQTQRASAIIERVRGYAKHAGTKPSQTISIGSLVQQCVRDFRLLARRAPQFRLDIDARASTRGDPVELALVILNLFKNATEAMEQVADAHIDVHVDDASGMWRLTIADNGPTVVDVAAFDDLFTPKASRKAGGLGVGLAISARIMEQCAGRLTIEANAPSGLKAVLLLPKADA